MLDREVFKMITTAFEFQPSVDLFASIQPLNFSQVLISLLVELIAKFKISSLFDQTQTV